MIPIQKLLSQTWVSIPENLEEEFIKEQFYINISRLKLLTILLVFLGITLACLDFRNLNIQMENQLSMEQNDILYFQLLLTVHLVLSFVVFLFALLFWTKGPVSPDGVSLWHQFWVMLLAAFFLVACTIITVVDYYYYKIITVYILSCFGIANMLYLKPRFSFVIYFFSFIIFIAGISQNQSNAYILTNHYINGTITVFMAWAASSFIYNTRARDFINRKTIEVLSTQDSLTGIANRRCFETVVGNEWNRAVRERNPFTIILADIDFYKRFNDMYGHQAGDDCLKKIAGTLVASLKRPTDLVARYGGEEFVVILPNTGREGAVIVAERLRKRIEELKIPHAGSSISQYITISLGVYTTVPDRFYPLAGVIKKADEALYRAKAKGRNRIEVIAYQGK